MNKRIKNAINILASIRIDDEYGTELHISQYHPGLRADVEDAIDTAIEVLENATVNKDCEGVNE